MRIRRPSQPVVPPGKKDGLPTKAGNVRGSRDAIKTKSLPEDPAGKPQPKAGNMRGSRTALRLKDLLVGTGSDSFRGLGNSRARRPDALKPQGIRGDRDGFVDSLADKLKPKAGNSRGARPTLRTKDLPIGLGDRFHEAGNARARRPNAIRREDGSDGFMAPVSGRRSPGPVEVTPRVLEPSVEPSAGRELTGGEPLTAVGPATLGDGFGPGVPGVVDEPDRPGRRPRSGNVRGSRGGIGR